MALKNWEKIGTQTKHFANMYGKKNSKEVIYVDNWTRGSYAVVLGLEHKSSKKYLTYYEEKEVLGNFGTRKEAIKSMKEYIKTH